MTWLIVGICVLLVGIIIYYSIPLFKKIFKNRNSNKSVEKETKRAIKREERRAEKREKNDLKKSKEHAPKPVVSAEQDSENSLVNENAIELKEDPDERVNTNNLKYEGYFDSVPTPPTNQKPIADANPLEENVDDLFNKIFNVDERDRKSGNKAPTFVSDGMNGNEEIGDFLEEFETLNSRSARNSIAEDFDRLSPEMKALMISNFLDRKE